MAATLLYSFVFLLPAAIRLLVAFFISRTPPHQLAEHTQQQQREDQQQQQHASQTMMQSTFYGGEGGNASILSIPSPLTSPSSWTDDDLEAGGLKKDNRGRGAGVLAPGSSGAASTAPSSSPSMTFSPPLSAIPSAVEGHSPPFLGVVYITTVCGYSLVPLVPVAMSCPIMALFVALTAEATQQWFAVSMWSAVLFAAVSSSLFSFQLLRSPVAAALPGKLHRGVVLGIVGVAEALVMLSFRLWFVPSLE